jgi:hypothetical protein
LAFYECQAKEFGLPIITHVRCSQFANSEQNYLFSMKAHNDMRPHDVVVLLKILILNGQAWQYRHLSASLHIVVSEIAESLNRNHMAGLIDKTKRNVHRQSLMEFIEHGLHYVFPQVPAQWLLVTQRGSPTPFIKRNSVANWNMYGLMKQVVLCGGQMILPLYKNASKASQSDHIIEELCPYGPY